MSSIEDTTEGVVLCCKVQVYQPTKCYQQNSYKKKQHGSRRWLAWATGEIRNYRKSKIIY